MQNQQHRVVSWVVAGIQQVLVLRDAFEKCVREQLLGDALVMRAGAVEVLEVALGLGGLEK